MDIEQRIVHLTDKWQFHKVYRNYHEAFCDIGNVKNQGFAAVKIQDMSNEHYSIFTISFKGVKANG